MRGGVGREEGLAVMGVRKGLVVGGRRRGWR